MERHAEIGHRMLRDAVSELLDLAASIALTHDERYDGTGYPRACTGRTSRWRAGSPPSPMSSTR